MLRARGEDWGAAKIVRLCIYKYRPTNSICGGRG